MLSVTCITNTGLPIFNRKLGNCDTLPFSTIGSLNGVHMFCKNQDISLKKTEWEEGLIVWEEFDDLLFFAVAKGVSEHILRFLVHLSYYAIIFTIGKAELQLSCQNPERLKRELKTTLVVIDKLLEEVDSEYIRFSDCILSDQNALLLDKLNDFCIQFGSPFACLLIRQKIAVATEGWWDLDIVDRKLLITLLTASSSVQNDVPVFLPKKSSNIAYRLISVPILQNVILCVLCGAEPTYMEIQNLVQQIYTSALSNLQMVEQHIPSKNLPDSIALDAGIMGLVLINRTASKCVVARNVPHTGKRNATNHRLDILRTFYHQAVDMIDAFLNRGVRTASQSLRALESYWSSEYYKLHAMVRHDNLICIMYVAAIPVQTMRIITEATLEDILKEKDICW